MSMPALLSHFGLSDRRFVTQDGRIIFDGVKYNAEQEFVHSKHGTVTPVASHTFHGGAEPEDLSPDVFWWEEGHEIERHVEGMKIAFPDFEYVPADGSQAPCWWGQIDTGRGRFAIVLILRKDRGIPSVSVLNRTRLGASSAGRWRRSPHLYDNGNLCIADRDDWDPGEHTVVTATTWTAHWLAAFTEWRISRRWPVAGFQPVAG